ncbi:MAG: hypothetical protein NTW87_15735 [Planctomycetota bacterium]|nr:hypothetical protein [Planctomycetota bacterium]
MPDASPRFENRMLRRAAYCSWALLLVYAAVTRPVGPVFSLRLAIVVLWLMLGVHAAYYGALLIRGFRIGRMFAIAVSALLVAIAAAASYAAGIEAGITVGLAVAALVGFALTWSNSVSLALGVASVAVRALLFLLALACALCVSLLPIWSWYATLYVSVPEYGSPTPHILGAVATVVLLLAAVLISWRARRAARALLAPGN